MGTQTGKQSLIRRQGWLLQASIALLGLGVIATFATLGLAKSEAGSLTPSPSFTVAGSTTLFPLTEAQMELFGRTNPEVGMTLEATGTGEGVRKFCVGEVAIVNASRPLSASEVGRCSRSGVRWVELRRALDGVSVVVSVDSPLGCVSFSDLQQLVGPLTHGDSSAFEAGASLAAISDIVGPERKSGTFDAFVDIAMKPGGVTVGDSYEPVVDHDELVAKVSGSDTVLGWTSLSVAETAVAAGLVQILPTRVDEASACSLPSKSTIASGQFPLTRVVYSYVNTNMVETDPGVEQFVDMMLSKSGQRLVEPSGLVGLGELAQVQVRSSWESGKKDG